VLNGYNATLFAYGMTGTGKTYTIFGNKVKDVRRSKVKMYKKGVIDLLVKELFAQIEDLRNSNTKFKITLSYIEIYNEQIHDMLSD
jgi:hypothetical protein